jgi:hypothetical protein
MALEKFNKESYVSILSSDGTLRLVVPEGTEGSVVREYEDSKGNKGSKTELVFNKLVGKIVGIEFKDGDYGKSIQVSVDDGATDPVILSINTAQNFGEDFLKKLPNINLEKEVTLAPYAFEADGKVKKGITITQDGEKIKNFFYDEEKKEVCNKYPKPKGDTAKYDKDDWKIYFMEARKFLVKYAEEHFVSKKETADSKFEAI